ncbi:Na(+)/H(+) antiporter NhaD [Filimonas sp.]|nr:Na(+)/H(+) antiporter NhaD [Filimonas sp.]
MTIVELIDLYDGFQLIIDKIRTTNKRKLLIIVTILSFFLSAVLDNLTTAIVMASLVRKILSEKEDRLIFIGMIVIAANAGGSWSPIGDVTTTMLWIGNQITPLGIVKSIFIPSLVATLIPLMMLIFRLKGAFIPLVRESESGTRRSDQSIILYTGLILLLFVPLFKMLTHLPPFMGMMLAVGILWLLSETLQKRQTEESNPNNSIFTALERIDMPSILFFMGILLAVSALQSFGLLETAAVFLSNKLHNDTLLVSGIGLLSAVFDNVPLVAAVQGMFQLSQYATDHFFWRFLAFCSGTGGSILIIGSAAGVAVMGIEQIDFFWYLRKISPAALLGYLAGALTCVLLSS